MKRPSLTTLKAIWRDQISDDHRLTPSTFKLGYKMADFMTMKDTATHYRKAGKIIIFPSQETLRKRTALAPDTVRTAIRQLIDRGHLRKLKRGNQFTGSNEYRVLVKERNNAE